MRPSVLIIDDNDVNLELATYLLRQAGFEVSTAGDAAQGLAMVQLSLPHLVLLDIQMPGTDGLEVLRQLRSSPRTQSLRVIAFTAYAMAGDETRLLAAGLDGYLSKPIDVARFATQVRAFMA